MLVPFGVPHRCDSRGTVKEKCRLGSKQKSNIMYEIIIENFLFHSEYFILLIYFFALFCNIFWHGRVGAFRVNVQNVLIVFDWTKNKTNSRLQVCFSPVDGVLLQRPHCCQQGQCSRYTLKLHECNSFIYIYISNKKALLHQNVRWLGEIFTCVTVSSPVRRFLARTLRQVALGDHGHVLQPSQVRPSCVSDRSEALRMSCYFRNVANRGFRVPDVLPELKLRLKKI